MVFGLEKERKRWNPPPPLGLGWCDSEASCFHPPAPLVASCASFFLLFFSFLLYPLKTNTHTQEKGQKSCLGGGVLYRVGSGVALSLVSPSWGLHVLGDPALGCVSPLGCVPHAVCPSIPPPPSASGGFLRSQTVPTPPPTVSPGPCAFVSPPLGGTSAKGPPLPPPQTSTCPLCGRLALPPPSSWQLGLTGPRGRCCWQPSPAHTYGGGQQLRAPPPPKTNSFPPNLLPVAPRGFF